MLLANILAFLVPLAIYCWVLATINRRSKPTMVSGLWDCVGMLLGAAGILLVVVPLLIHRLFLEKYQDAFTLDDEDEVLHGWWIVWGLYFTLLPLGVCLMLWWRRNKTVIYNVDLELFNPLLHHSLEFLGMKSTQQGNRWAIWEKAQGQEATEIPQAEFIVETFPPMCNVSLHWVHGEKKLRTALEDHLAHELEGVRTFDNPAASWFMGFSGLLCGLIFLTAMVWILLNYFPPRHW